MANLETEIRITANTEGVGEALRRVRSEVDSTGAALSASEKRAEELRKALEDARSGGASMQEISRRTRELEDHLSGATERAQQMTQRLEGVRTAGLAMAAAGGAGLLLASHLAKVAEEGNAVEQRLESILTAQKRLQDLGSINDAIGDIAKRGHLPDDDPVREAVVQMTSDQVATNDIPKLLEAAARNAEALKQPIDQIGTLFAKAYAEGNLSRLKRANILFSEQEDAAVKAAYGISEAAGRAAFMDVVMASTARSTGELGSGLTDAAKAAGDAARALDDAQTNIGTGAADAKRWVDSLAASLLETANASPELEQTAGKVGYIGSAALGAIGGVASVGSQIGLTALALDGMGFSAAAAFAKITTGATTAGLAIKGALLSPLGVAGAGAVLGVAGYEALRNKETTDSAGEMASDPGGTWKRFAGRTGQWFLQNDAMEYDRQQSSNFAGDQSTSLFDKLRAKSAINAVPDALSRVTATANTAPPAAFSSVLANSGSGMPVSNARQTTASLDNAALMSAAAFMANPFSSNFNSGRGTDEGQGDISVRARHHKERTPAGRVRITFDPIELEDGQAARMRGAESYAG